MQRQRRDGRKASTRLGSERNSMTFEEMFAIYTTYKITPRGKKGKAPCKRDSVSTTERRLKPFLAPVWLQDPRDFSADTLVQLLETYSIGGRDGRSPVTTNNCFREMRALLRWMRRQEYVTQDWVQGILESEVLRDAMEEYPSEGEEKLTLTINEARVFAEAAKAEASEAPRSTATGALVALYLDLRANEIITRTARHVDDNGRVLWVDKKSTKTRAGERAQQVADEDLAELLVRAAEGLQSQERVFRFTRHGLYEAINRICRDCGLPEVGCHGLRRTFATVAAMSGVAEEAVAKALGHADRGAVARKHYIKAGTLEQVRTDAVLRRLRSV